MIPYKILRSNQTSALEILVEIELTQGYTLLGAPTAYWDHAQDQPQFVQAVVLRAHSEPELE